MRFASSIMLSVASVIATLSVAQAQIANDKVRIGVLTDMSGVFESGTGAGSVEAAKMAAEEFGMKVNGKPIEILFADHQNKPDVGSTIANKWYDVDKVDMITDLVNSAVAYSVLNVAKQKNKMIAITSAGTADFTGKDCAPDNSVHWVYDSYMLGAAIGAAVPQLGKKWFLLNADYAFGAAMEVGVTAALKKNGAEVVGTAKHPLSTNDFSSFILQAKASGADVLALNSGGDDNNNAIKAAKEFGLTAKIVGFGLDSPTALRAMGLQVGQGAWYVTPWLQQDDAETKKWVDTFIARRKSPPGSFQVGTYSAVRSYLKAVEATNSTDSKTVIAKMREMPIKDVFTQNGKLRPDGRMVHDAALLQLKTPAESKGEWDFTKVMGALKGDDIFRPMSEGGCPAVANLK